MIENIISYSEFLDMPYKDFKRLEAVWMFRNKQVRNKPTKEKQEKVKANLSNIPAKSVKNLGFSDEQLKGIFGDK